MNSPAFNGSPDPGVGSTPLPSIAGWERPVPIAKMLMRVAERRNGVKVEHGEDLDAWAVGDKLPMLRHAPVMFRLVPRKENDDRMQIGARKPADPMFGRVQAAIAKHLRPRRHALLELLRKRRERSLVQSKRAKPIPGESRRHPALVLIDAGAHRRRRMNRLLDRRHPGAAAGPVAKREKFVPGRERRARASAGSVGCRRIRASRRFLFSDLMASRRSPPRLCIDLPLIAVL